MPRKDEFLSQLLSSKTQEIVSSPRNYTAFLQTAAQNYKYRFQEQVLIHAQRPDATGLCGNRRVEPTGPLGKPGCHRYCPAPGPKPSISYPLCV